MALSEKKWYKLYLDEICHGNSEDERLAQKPGPCKWAAYFLDSIKLDEDEGQSFRHLCVSENLRILDAQLTAIEELVLDADVDTVTYQIESEERRSPPEGQEKKHFYETQKTVLHYAVLTGSVEMCRVLISLGASVLIDRNDFITGFTPFHLALFTQNRSLMWYLMSVGADVSLQDSYGATAFDYGRLLRFISPPSPTPSLSFYEADSQRIIPWSVTEFERTLKVTWEPFFRADLSYIEELLFSGKQVGEKDQDFRSKYSQFIGKDVGGDDLFIGFVSESIGFGVFAKKDLAVGSYITRYGGCFQKAELSKDRSYCMTSSVSNIVIDSREFRNLGGLVNHSSRPNAEAISMFEQGVDQAMLIATAPIKKGEQIFIDYSENYFDSVTYEEIEMRSISL
eukprot:TRINITY_DN1586_c1_g1_i1.p1 TRINITY_DN1586_c1_g1~~TRINITY_DN1586_c1_g1_i1.p1  ORF type:complete len:412 (-),score=88.79 TRINITY_DN1586_c1_g1_i1:115-1305(-)